MNIANFLAGTQAPEPLSGPHQAALEYAARGLKVFPCGPDNPSITDPAERAKAAKKPACAHGFLDATTDPAVINRWWTENPRYNIGAVPSSIGYVVVDLDVKDGKDGMARFEGLAQHHGGRAAEAWGGTWTAETATGGQHRWYEGSVERDGPAGAVAPGIDVKSRNGYVLMPPSVVNGRSYAWRTEDWWVAPLPEWFAERHAAAIAKPAKPTDDRVATGGPPLTPEEIEARLFACDPSMGYAAWRDLAGALHATSCSDEAFDKRDAFVRWSRDGGNYSSDEAAERVYDTMPPKEGGVGAGTFMRMTNQAGYAEANRPSNGGDPTTRFAGVAVPLPTSGYPVPKSAAELVAGHFPRAEYLWAKFILQGFVNLLYGDGGAGKTLLAEHIAVAVAAGVDLFGLKVQRQPVLLVLAEDDDGETKARLEAICAMLGVNFADLPIWTWCLPGWDATIAHIADDGAIQPGEFMEPLRAWLAGAGPCFLVLDTVSDIATLDENKRLPVNKLCKVVLTGLCREFEATILVNAHPSKAAMENGTHYAGSTAWNNAVRNRLTLTRPDKKKALRVLEVSKANYGGAVQLDLYQVGLTFITSAASGRSEAEEREIVLTTVLSMIDKGISVVRTHGLGQTPQQVADAIREEHGLTLTKKEVLAHLGALERKGRLRYEEGGNKTRGQRAGFRRPDAVANPAATPSQALS